MVLLNILLFNLFTSFISACNDSTDLIKLTPCELCDMPCLSTLINQYFEQTYRGIPSVGLAPIDPLVIPCFDVSLHDSTETTLYYKNLILKGLRKQNLRDFKLDPIKKYAMMIVEVCPTMTSNLTIEMTNPSRTFVGSVTMSATALVKARCDFEYLYDGSGAKHFDYGPEQLHCKLLGQVDLTPSPEIQAAIDEGLCSRKIKNMFCTILKEAFVTVIGGIRIAAREILPVSGIIKGI